MTWRPFLLALLLPLWVTGATLASVSRNRAGGREPIVLSEREVYTSPRNADNTAATLWLSWHSPSAVGSGLPRKEDYRTLPRRAFVALELDGPAFRALPIERERERASRLVVVDIDPDGEVLAQRYPDARRHLISAANVRLARGGSYAGAMIVNLEPSQLHVPPPLAARLPRPELRRDGAAPPFDVEIRYGVNAEPWVTAVRPRP